MVRARRLRVAEASNAAAMADNATTAFDSGQPIPIDPTRLANLSISRSEILGAGRTGAPEDWIKKIERSRFAEGPR